MAAFAGLALGAWIPGPFDILVLGIAYLLAMGLLVRKEGWWSGSFWGWRRKFKHIAVAAVFFLLFLLPYLISVRARTGQFLGHFTRHVQWYAAVERTGQPIITGERTSIEDYLFKGKSFAQPAMKLIKGYRKIFLDPENRFNKVLLSCGVDQHWNWILWPFLLLGIAICCFKVLLFPVICLFFLNGLPIALNEYFELRIMFHAAPFFACFTSMGLVWAWNKSRDFKVGRKTKTPQF